MTINGTDWNSITDWSTESTGTASDGGTGDMDFWSHDDEQQVNEMQNGAVLNFSSYDIPGAVLGVKDITEATNNTISDPGTAGDGESGNMQFWGDPYNVKIDRMQGGSLVNNSSFQTPHTITYGSDFQGRLNERAGLNVTGNVVDSGGTPVSGEVSLRTESGTLIGKSRVSGSFSVNLGIPLGVSSGDNKPQSTRNFQFTPDASGIKFTEDNTPIKYDAGTVVYGLLEGVITDYNGDPVPNVAVTGPGAAAITDEDGSYSMLGPGGRTETLTTLRQSVDVDVEFDENSVTVKDFQFPQLTVRVLDSDFRPVSGAPVEIDNVIYYTKDNGKVEVPDAEVKQYDVTVMDEFESSFGVDSLGQEFVFTLGPPDSFSDFPGTDGLGGIEIEVTDEQTGQPVVNVNAIEQISGTKASANRRGKIRLLVTETGQNVSVQIAKDHNRYRQKTINETITEGEIVDKTVRLERIRRVGNRQ